MKRENFLNRYFTKTKLTNQEIVRSISKISLPVNQRIIPALCSTKLHFFSHYPYLETLLFSQSKRKWLSPKNQKLFSKKLSREKSTRNKPLITWNFFTSYLPIIMRSYKLGHATVVISSSFFACWILFYFTHFYFYFYFFIIVKLKMQCHSNLMKLLVLPQNVHAL